MGKTHLFKVNKAIGSNFIKRILAQIKLQIYTKRIFSGSNKHLMKEHMNFNMDGLRFDDLPS